MSVFIFAIGTLFGFVLTVVYYRRKRVGTLRIDTSDAADGPYFFLEIESGKGSSISNRKTILLDVNTANYISQE